MTVFHFIMVQPSHYDDDGYVIQWVWSAMPSNSLATLHGLARDCAERRVLGEDVEIRLTAINEPNTRVDVRNLARRVRRDGGQGLVGMVGVQSNQYPRSLDLARQFLAEGLPVCLGGFHVSGALAMLPGVSPELQEALDLGISLFAGEAEGRLERVLQDAFRGELQPVYNHLDDLPSLESTPPPILPARLVKQTAGRQSSFDAGRGCPFKCSFCTIINVQGRTSRFRSADDIERIVRENHAQGVNRFFVTDDNFARNQNWEAIFDRLIELADEGLKVKLALQVDTLCHKIPSFIEKSRLAGVRRVFVGLESIDPKSLLNAQKPQNRITEYRQMFQAWRAAGVVTNAGYIIGFPGDTPEKVRRDVEILKRELPVDIVGFLMLTPLPGCEDHKVLHERGAPMDPDLNKYDLNHVTTVHDTMSEGEWLEAQRVAEDTYYTEEHIETLLRRAAADGLSLGKVLGTAVSYYSSVRHEGVQPLEVGLIRRKYRRDRRPGMSREAPGAFHFRLYRHAVLGIFRAARMHLKFRRLRKELEADPEAQSYLDVAIQPVTPEELAELELFTVSEDARAAAEKAHKLVQLGSAEATGLS